MPSQVDGVLSNIESGPCKITIDAGGSPVTPGHTFGGVRFNVTPDVRVRNVDEYGTSVADLVYQGEDIEVTTVFSEKSMTVIAAVFAWGYARSATVWGFGRIPGRKGSTLAKELLIHPLSAGGAATEDVTFWLAAVSDSAEVEFGVITGDRVFGVTWKILIDESQTDGYLLGQIGAATA